MRRIPINGINRPLNWKRDSLDHRDWKFKETMRPRAEVLPSSIDMRLIGPQVFDQGEIGSCTANALCGAIGYLESEYFEPFSRLFLYYKERVIEGDVEADNGAQIRDGIKALSNYGTCKEASWPYEKGLLFVAPTQLVEEEAAKHKIVRYKSLENSYLDEMQQCLSDGFPFCFGFTVFPSFRNMQNDYVLQPPGPDETPLGGHAVCCVGYDNSNQWFIIRNSWGKDWGDQGYFYMPYRFMMNKDYVADLWSIEK